MVITTAIGIGKVILQGIGAYTVADKLLLPATEALGRQLGRSVGNMMAKLDNNGNKANGKKMVEDDEAKAKAIMELIAECDRELAENETEQNPVNAIPVVGCVMDAEPKFDEETVKWIKKCKKQYGGFKGIAV